MATSVLLLLFYCDDATLLPVFVPLYRKYVGNAEMGTISRCMFDAAFRLFTLAVMLLRNKALPNLGDHLQDFHRKSDEYRTSALFALDTLPCSSFGRFKPPRRYVLFRVCFTSFHGGK